jgi:hypothetical protein
MHGEEAEVPVIIAELLVKGDNSFRILPVDTTQ